MYNSEYFVSLDLGRKCSEIFAFLKRFCQGLKCSLCFWLTSVSIHKSSGQLWKRLEDFGQFRKFFGTASKGIGLSSNIFRSFLSELRRSSEDFLSTRELYKSRRVDFVKKSNRYSLRIRKVVGCSYKLDKNKSMSGTFHQRFDFKCSCTMHGPAFCGVAPFNTISQCYSRYQ